MDACLELSDIVVRRGRHTILAFERVTVRGGEFVGVVGPNGAGKTTFLKLCCGLIRPTRGVVAVEGRRLSRTWWRMAACRRHIGYIPQQTEYNAHLPFTVREIVAMGRASHLGLGRRLRRDDYAKVDFWLDQMGLYGRRGQTFRSLSGGQQQRTLIARAMVAEPRLILMDEPGANLDAAAKQGLVETLERLFGENRLTVLLVSHEPGLIPGACGRLLFMQQGRIVADGSRREVLDSAAAREAFGSGWSAGAAV